MYYSLLFDTISLALFKTKRDLVCSGVFNNIIERKGDFIEFGHRDYLFIKSCKFLFLLSLFFCFYERVVEGMK